MGNGIWTLLLDIDGTLMRTQGAGLRAICAVMEERYGVKQLPEIQVHGRTDHGIWYEIFEKLGIAIPDSLEELIDDYCLRLERELNDAPGVLLPGVIELLKRLKDDPNVAVGILTGNARRAAEIKLRRFQLEGFIEPFGGFGDRYSDRNDVAMAALDSAGTYLGAKFSPSRCVVIGDTTNDIRCARSIGAKVIAVCTGGQDRISLSASQPDLVLDDLSQHENVIFFITGN